MQSADCLAPFSKQQLQELASIAGGVLRGGVQGNTFERLLILAVCVSGADAGSFGVRLRGEQWDEHHHGFLPADTPEGFLEKGFPNYALTSQVTVNEHRVTRHPMFSSRTAGGVSAELTIPRPEEGPVYAVLDLLKRRGRFSEAGWAAATRVADLAATIATAARDAQDRLERVQRELSEARALARTGLALSGTAWNLDPFAAYLLNQALVFTRANVAQLWVRDRGRGILRLRRVAGPSGPQEDTELEIDSPTLVAECARSGQRICASNTQDPEWSRRYLPLTPSSRSLLAIPIKNAGSCIGVLNLQSDMDAAFPSDDIEVATSFAERMAIPIASALLVQAFGRISAAVAGGGQLEDFLDVAYSSGETLFPDVGLQQIWDGSGNREIKPMRGAP